MLLGVPDGGQRLTSCHVRHRGFFIRSHYGLGDKMKPEQAQQIDDALRLAEGLLLTTHAVGGDLRRVRDARDTVASLVSEGNALTSSSSTANNFNTVDLMADNKKVCEECGSDDVLYFCTAKFDPNDDYKYIEMCDPAFDETFEWCNECKEHTVFKDKNEEA